MASQGTDRRAVSVHRVRPGETMGRIARDHGVPLPALLKANPQIANANLILPGQTVHLPAGAHAHGHGHGAVGGAAGATPKPATPRPPAPVPANGSSPAPGIAAAGFQFIYREEHVDGISEHLHWPKGASGVTLGSGYDMRYRSQAQIVRDLTAIGMSADMARIAAGGSGLHGESAHAFARDHHGDVTLTREAESRLLAASLRDPVATIAQTVKVPLTQNQHDALVSLVFNIGEPHFRGSTVLQKLNAGDYAGAAEAMRMWNKSGGAVSQVLVGRRQREIAMFNRADASGPRAALPAAPAKGGMPFHHAAPTGNAGGGRFADIVRRRGGPAAIKDLDAGRLVLVGVRTATMLNVNGGKGEYDDTMAIVRMAGGKAEAATFRLNTEPSTQYLYRKSPADINGDGRPDLGEIESGQTVRYQMSTFLGHEALKIPPSDMVKVRRDVNHDNRMDTRDPVSSIARAGGMHIHIGGPKNTWSSGCQTLPPDDHARFFATLKRWAPQQKDFNYVLVDAPG